MKKHRLLFLLIIIVLFFAGRSVINKQKTDTVQPTTAPIVTVAPTEEPDTIPQSADEMTATFAGPPAAQPAILFARSIKNADIPVLSRKAPKTMNTTMNFAQTCAGVPITPPVEKKSV